MANRKISQFTTTTDITTVQGLAGYDATTNVQISGSALITSLEANLYKPFGNDGDVLTLVNGAPAWVAGGGGPGGNATMQDVYNNSNAATVGVIGATLNTADLQLTNNEITFTSGAKGKFESNDALTLESVTNKAFLKGSTGVEAESGAGITLKAGTDVILQSDSGNNQYEFAFTANGEIRLDGSFGNDNEVILSNGSGNQVEWGKIQLGGLDKSVNGVLEAVNGGTGVGGLTDENVVIGGGAGSALGTVLSKGKGRIIVGETTGANVDRTTSIPVGSDGQVLTVDTSLDEGVKWDTPSTGATYTFDATGANNPNLRLTDGTTNQDVQLVGSGNTTVSNNANVITISSTGGSGGASAFTTITTDSATGDAEWDYANDGPNIEFTPEFPGGSFWNLIKLKNNVMPADGDHGYLILNPSVTQTFQLPSNSLILDGDVLPGGTNTVTYEWVYDGTNFHWEKQPNQISPIYAPFNPFPTANLLGTWDPETLNPAIIQYGNPYNDDAVPDDPGTGDITVNYAVGNGGSWINSYSSSTILPNLIASQNPAVNSTSYKPSFVVNYMGGLQLVEYNSSSTPDIIIPNPTTLAGTTNSQTFYFQEFTANGSSGSYTTAQGEVLTVVGGINTGEKARFNITSDGTDITTIEVTNAGKGYALGDLIQIDMNNSGLGSGYIYILLNDKDMLGGSGSGVKRACAVQMGYSNDTDLSTGSGSDLSHPGFGTDSTNDRYRFTNTTLGTPQSFTTTVVIWISGQYPTTGSYNTLFDFTDSPASSTYGQAMYFNGTTHTFEPDSSGTFDELPELTDFSGTGGVNFNNEWTYMVFNFIPTGNQATSSMVAYLANQSTLNNAGTTGWDYGGSRTVDVDANGFCIQTLTNVNFQDTTWTQFGLGNSYYVSNSGPIVEGWRAKIGKFAIYNGLLPIVQGNNQVVNIFNNTKGYYGIT